MEKKSDKKNPKYPGKRITTNGNLLVSSVEGLAAEAGVFYPITPSTEMGENFQNLYSKGKLNAFGKSLVAIETEGEHAAQGGAIAMSVTGKRTVNFTSGQGIVYGLEQYYHAPGKLSTMVLEVGARALTKHALNVHCGHDDVYATLDTGWITLFGKDAQQAADQALILRKVTELSLNPGINAQDGFLTTHLERTFRMPEAALVREFLGSPDDIIATPTKAQRTLFGETRRRVPIMMDLKNPLVLGPVQNQEHYMNGVAARRNNFSEHILGFLEDAYKEFGELTGRNYGLISEYNTENADTVFIAIGSGAENIEAVVDLLKEERGVDIGVIHVNVIRPFPENAIIRALKGKKYAIILERTDESLAGTNPLTRDIKAALIKATENHYHKSHVRLDALDPEEVPRIFTGVYGLGSRDFRPEHIIGAYDYAFGRVARQDGLKKDDGKSFFYLGIDHPYAVVSKETPSGLPKDSIAVRFHSIGGWGMITTGKNLGMIIGDFSTYVAERDGLIEADGSPKEVIHVSANPKYGSEKKGAPTNYFMVAAPERIRVNCDLRHVDVVLCCDPKAFLHTNPLDGLREGGSFVWESSEHSSEEAWKRIPKKYRQEIIDKKIKLYGLNGFEIARHATEREDLQTRMQGNSFLGAFFGVSSFLNDYHIPKDEFLDTVKKQYESKFGRFGEAVVSSNMLVMKEGFEGVFEIKHGKVEDDDTSTFLARLVTPCEIELYELPTNGNQKAPLYQMATFDKEFRAGLGYNQPSSPLASVGMMAAGTGSTASKYVARREVPVYKAENCTQCMECIVACPDTALPNTAQDISTIIRTTIRSYVSDEKIKDELLAKLPEIDAAVRAEMIEKSAIKGDNTKFGTIVMDRLENLGLVKKDSPAYSEMQEILTRLPIAFHNVKGIFSGKEKKEPGEGGIFSIFVSDLCKGCGACVSACGSHEALVMAPETEEIHTDYKSAINFLDLLGNTPRKYLGLYNPDNPEESKAATLKFHLMLRSQYEALMSGDGACAGCGEKSVLHAVASLTEAMMRPIFHRKSDRLTLKADDLESNGVEVLKGLKAKDPAMYDVFRQAVLHLVMGLGGTDDKETKARIEAEFKGSDKEIIEALAAVLRQNAFNLKDLQAIEGKLPNGMSAMAMTAHTGCNTVYGSTPSNTPHPYPWMNSLFQDGATIGWLVGESFMTDHARMSVIPERLTNFILEGFSKSFTQQDYFTYTHFSDMDMTDNEIHEMPKVWAIGGDGGMGDIGYQNVSKVVMQNRPNVKMVLLDTQVYSNTGGQNSESSPMPGGFDMNQFGAATQGKHTERKSVAESFLSGHGSPFLAQVSLANSGTLYKAIMDGLYYRGTAFYQAYTPCMPEHGIPDYAAEIQALRSRDSRGMPEFVFNPSLGETYFDALDVKTNQSYQTDWATKLAPVTKKRYTFTVAHWAFTEARFRFHHKIVKPEAVEGLISLEDKIKLITMDDVINRRHTDPNHRSYIPDFGVYTIDYDENGNEVYHTLSTQMVLFAVERRKAWRMLQSRAGVINKDYEEQKALLAKIDNEGMSVDAAIEELAHA
ncbi:MAG: 2-oxoacid:acceptor oxidoreductase family protein [Cyclobacteriaceae bacterium]|nr:2-oxoacid:acceptor oxidoreductase family protein [Cyclobacteriaceae bacterium]